MVAALELACDVAACDDEASARVANAAAARVTDAAQARDAAALHPSHQSRKSATAM